VCDKEWSVFSDSDAGLKVENSGGVFDVYVTNYSTNYRHHVVFMTKLLSKLSSLNKSSDANFANTKSHNTSSVMRALWGA